MYDRQKLAQLRQKLEKWEETTLHGSISRLPERQEQFITTSSELVNRLYTPLDVAETDYLADLDWLCHKIKVLHHPRQVGDQGAQFGARTAIIRRGTDFCDQSLDVAHFFPKKLLSRGLVHSNQIVNEQRSLALSIPG